ncbi:hypothetical protein HW555_002139 [Spodoptera exigua]|uniref:Uncharacterized protein n=1 Tax=Spodoptera exigua TaxID=7107 RepID=A0A835GSS6_SPOEX|nr:hypothetical protein HW555_002139 [Spodoptera exigua]
MRIYDGLTDLNPVSPSSSVCVPGCDCHDIYIDLSALVVERLQEQVQDASHLHDVQHWLALHLHEVTVGPNLDLVIGERQIPKYTNRQMSDSHNTGNVRNVVVGSGDRLPYFDWSTPLPPDRLVCHVNLLLE